MSIVGLGTDVVAVARVRRLYRRYSWRFAERILAPTEVARLTRHADASAYLARRYAAKEAAAKALGTGIGRYCGFRDVTVLTGAAGRPELSLHAAAAATARRLGAARAHVSLSDEREYAVAVVILEA